MATRIQRRRTKGWHMPEGAIYVGRPSRWGNPWTVCADPVAAYRGWLDEVFSPQQLEAFTAPLKGHDLACWCRLDQPCHADVLLEIANR